MTVFVQPMKRALFFIFSFSLGLTTYGQDSLQTERSSGPEIWVDYGKILLYATDFESKLEGGINWKFGRIAPAIHVGYAELFPSQAIKNGEYSSKGMYFRGGIEYFLPIDRNNRIIVGGRYAYATFEEEAKYTITSDLWPDQNGNVSRQDLTASWVELVLGSEMSFRETRWILGGYFTLRYLLEREEFDPIDTYAIPGYGRTSDKTVPALQLYLKYSLAR